ncbi:MAG: HTH domain-containing protein [Promethearchaeota archaeon]
MVEVADLLSTLQRNIHEVLRPSEELYEIDLLLDNLRVYAKRVKGITLSDEDYRLQPYKDFSGMVVTPRERTYNSLLRRLKVILRFNITSYEKVTRDLLRGLVSDEVDRLTGREIRLMTLLYQRPTTPQREIAKEMKVSLPTIRKDIKSLEEKIDLRFANLIDWGRFKLRHYGLIFNTKGVDVSRYLANVLNKEMATYLSTVNFDTSLQRGFAAFRIPDQGKPVQLFLEQVEFLGDHFFEWHQLHQITKYHQSVCFDYFDYDTSTWMIEGDVSTLGLLNFVRENWAILPKPRGLSNTLARPFDKLDFYLTSFLVGDAHASMKKIMERLKTVDIEAPRTTISTRKNRLYKERTMEPFFTFSTPQLPFFITFAIRCEPHIAEQLSVAVAQMPQGFASITKIGCILHVYAPSRSLGTILNAISMTLEEEGVEEVWQMQEFKNMGAYGPAQLAPKWNGSYWTWSEDEFAIPSLGLEY